MSNFKAGNGLWLTKSLFLEESYLDKSFTLFTLKDQDHGDYKSLYKLYMSLEDPTEYVFANTYLGGWSHWQAIVNAPWFKPYITRWRTELELLLKATALKNVTHIANHPGHKQCLEANKFLLSYTKTANDKAGRPSKDSIRQEAERMFSQERETEEDLRRITQDLN